MNIINVGVIGVGFIGRWHIESLRRISGINVMAISEYCQEEANKWANILNIPYAYGNWTELIANPDINVVHICTPTSLHYEITKAALLANKHVVCEKPFTLKPNEAYELMMIAKERQLANAIHLNVRYYPLIHHTREMIKNGDLGRLLMISGAYYQDLLVKDTDYNWRMDPQYAEYSRVVSDIGTHWFDAAEFMTNMRVSSLCADFEIVHEIRKKPLHRVETYSSKVNASEDYVDVVVKNEDYASMLLRFDGKVPGTVTLCQTVPGRKNRVYFEIVGEKGTAVFDSERPNELWIGRRDGNNEIVMKDPSLLLPTARAIANLPGGHNEGYPDTSKQLFIQFYEHIRNHGTQSSIQPLFPTFEAGYRQMLLSDAALRSSKSRSWVPINSSQS